MRRVRAFTMLELVVLLCVLGMVAALLVLGASESRRQGGLGQSLANIKRLGASSFSYAGDHQNLTATFWWSQTEGHSEFSDLEQQRLEGGIASASAQAIDIVRRLHDESVPRVDGWVPFIFYSPLVLIEYLGERLPSPWLVSPGEKAALGWQDDVDLPNNHTRWRYYSSYELSTGMFEDEGEFDGTYQDRRLRQSATHTTWTVPHNPLLGRRSAEDFRFPSEKVYAYERYQWFFGPRDAFCLHPEARIPVLYADGRAEPAVVGEANTGWDPRRERSDVSTRMAYEPLDWEPPSLSDGSLDVIVGRIRWTRGGGKGRDFGGEEIDTGQR